MRRYAPNGNRPILHRKELLLDASDPDYARFAGLTDEEERAGLLLDTHDHRARARVVTGARTCVAW